MVELYIDGILVDLEEISISISSNSAFINNPYGITNKNYSFKVPKTSGNRRIFGYPDEANDNRFFNSEEHVGELYEDGELLISGKAVLSRSTSAGDDYFYIILINDVPEWIKLTKNLALKEINLDYAETITGELIENSWTADTAIRYFPVSRDVYDSPEYENEVAPIQILTYEDYHPFFNLSTLLHGAIAASEYKVISDFIDDNAGDLYVSGNYPEQDTAILKKRMDFYAVKNSDVTTTADSYGRVYTVDNHINSAGPIVDTADPTLTSDSNAFSNGNCFRNNDDLPVFIPSQDVIMCFEYNLKYRTEYRVKSASELSGIDSVTLEDGYPRQVAVPNKMTDYKNNYTYGQFIVCIFEYDKTAGYYLSVYHKDGNSITETFTDREYIIDDISDVSEIYLYKYISGTYTLTNDWGLYNYTEYLENTRNVDVYATVRSRPSLRRSGQTIYFNQAVFSGAEEGWSFTLKSGTSVRPVFYANPMEGSTVTAEELFAYTNKQSELIEAVRHMFNLCFLTNTEQKTIIIEPRDNFYIDELVDWTDRIDGTRSVAVEECCKELPDSILFRYASEDGTVKRWGTQNNTTYAAYEWVNPFPVSSGSDTVQANKFFSPSISETGSFTPAKSTWLLKAGDRDGELDSANNGNLNFGPKIVSYRGMKPIRSEENWGYPSYGKWYPYICFRDEEENVNLGFDDSGQISGLNKYYQSELHSSLYGKKISGSFFLTPADINSIIFPNGYGPDFRKLFRININGENVICRLVEMTNYKPGTGESTLCTFIKI
ncbi:MAG: hypothetical protein LIO79_01520 [Rikenellaceae bacterium]|nr:hypothetical protein [Rikenellaceae bacterium]